MLGGNMQQLREDTVQLVSAVSPAAAGNRFWSDYRSWDGVSPLKAQLETKDGQWLQATVYRSEKDDCDLMVFRRITEEQYQLQLQQAEVASQFKTSFLFRMSHEIRTPMNGVTGMLTLAESKLEPGHPAMQYLSRADELSEHLLSLINDILDMSRIEAGKVELEAAPFRLRVFGGKLYDMFSKTLDAKGIRYQVVFEEMTADWGSSETNCVSARWSSISYLTR